MTLGQVRAARKRAAAGVATAALADRFQVSTRTIREALLGHGAYASVKDPPPLTRLPHKRWTPGSVRATAPARRGEPHRAEGGALDWSTVLSRVPGWDRSAVRRALQDPESILQAPALLERVLKGEVSANLEPPREVRPRKARGP